VACADCGFTYLRNPPAYEQLVEEFAWEKTFVEEKARRDEETGLMRTLDKATAFRSKPIGPEKAAEKAQRNLKIFKQGRVLDIGCGRGIALPPPLIPFGIEISAGLHAEADEVMRARGGYAIHAPGIAGLEQFDAGFFDGVLMSSILEHEKNPRDLLRGVRRVLADGGKLYLKLPNFGSTNRKIRGGRWCGFRYPDHVSYFRVSDLARMAKEEGFHFRQTNLFTPFSDNMHVLLTKA
jgi:SAM-dependent methyltransferase